jgi:hypothetical protein
MDAYICCYFATSSTKREQKPRLMADETKATQHIPSATLPVNPGREQGGKRHQESRILPFKHRVLTIHFAMQ